MSGVAPTSGISEPPDPNSKSIYFTLSHQSRVADLYPTDALAKNAYKKSTALAPTLFSLSRTRHYHGRSGLSFDR